MRLKKTVESGKQYNPSVELFTWRPHSPDQCAICEHFERASTGGRPKRKRNVGRPATISTRTAINHIQSIAPSIFFCSPASHSWVATQSESASVSTSDLLCQLCSRLLDRPVQLTICNKLVCMTCLCKGLEDSGDLICPCCNEDHMREFTTMIQPSSVVMTILGNVKVKCSLCDNTIASGTFLNLSFTCTYHNYMYVVDYQRHLLSKCIEGLPQPASTSTVEDIISKSPEARLTPLEHQLTTSLVRRQLSKNPSGSGLLQVKTGGQVHSHPKTHIVLTKTNIYFSRWALWRSQNQGLTLAVPAERPPGFGHISLESIDTWSVEDQTPANSKMRWRHAPLLNASRSLLTFKRVVSR